MCYQPRFILNPTKDFYPFDSYKLEVDCNECTECRFRRRSDWSLRAYYELMSRPKTKYLNVFFTLTYSDEYLPVYQNQAKLKVYQIKCFSRDDIKRFFSNLRKRLNERFGVKDIAYLSCSEYGEQYQRPHYHVLLSVPLSYIDPFDQLDVFKLHKLIKNAWSHYVPRVVRDLEITPKGRYIKVVEKTIFDRKPIGWVLPDKNFIFGGHDRKGVYHSPLELASPLKASKYASKYTCKDLSFFNLPDVAELLQLWKDVRHDERHILYDRLHEFIKTLPFIYASRGFGECMTDIDKIDPTNTKLGSLIHGINTPFSSKRVQLPKYIKRKLTHSVHYVHDPCNPDKLLVRYELTQLGYDLKILNKRNMYEAKKTEFELFYKFVINSRVFLSFCREKQLNLNALKQFDCSDLALYTCFYRNKIYPADINQDFTLPIDTDIPAYNCSIDDLYNFADTFYESNLIHGIKYYNPKLSAKDLSRHARRFNWFRCFAGFDELIEIFNLYNRSLKKAYSESMQKQSDDKNKLRKANFNTF